MRAAPVVLVIAALGLTAPVAIAQRPPRAGLGGGGLIAFNACDDIDGRGSVLRTVRPDGSRLRRLRTFFPNPDPLPCGVDGDPAWSGDGRRLLFLDGVRFTINNPAGRRVRHAVPPPGGTGVRAYGFSPGGRSLAAIIWGVGPGGRDAIFRAGLDGRVHRRLTPYREGLGSLDWSLDGRRLVYARAQPGPGGFLEVRSVGASGRDDRRLALNAQDPVWSPDGRRIAFRRHGDIFVMRSDGRRARRVVDIPFEMLRRFDWSPDGRWLVYNAPDDEYDERPHALFFARIDGRGIRKLSLPAEVGVPGLIAWQPRRAR